MAIHVFIDGVPLDVSKDELFEMAVRGEIGPDTPIVLGATHTTVGKVKGIQFGRIVSPLASPDESLPVLDGEEIECYGCGMFLKPDTDFCPECGASTDWDEWQESLKKPPLVTSSWELKSRHILYGVVLVFCFFLFLGNISLKNDPEFYMKQRQEPQKKEEARSLNILEYRAVNKAQDKIKKGLLSPSGAKFSNIKAEHSRSTEK